MEEEGGGQGICSKREGVVIWEGGVGLPAKMDGLSAVSFDHKKWSESSTP